MNIFTKKHKKIFFVFDCYIDDKVFKNKAEANNGCIIKSKNYDYSISVCTGNGYESFLLCKEALDKIFSICQSNFDRKLLYNDDEWIIEIFEKAWQHNDE
jgi:hypothetical protein